MGSISSRNENLLDLCEKGDYNGVKNLLCSGLCSGQVNPAYRDKKGYTALAKACDGGHTKVVNILLKTGQAHPEYLYTNGVIKNITVLMDACNSGHYKIVKALLATRQAHPEYVDSDGWTALMYACEKGHTKIVRLLLNTGEAHPEYKTNQQTSSRTRIIRTIRKFANKWTALMLATFNNHINIIKLLLSTGNAQPGFEDYYGCTALDYTRDIKTFKYLKCNYTNSYTNSYTNKKFTHCHCYYNKLIYSPITINVS